MSSRGKRTAPEGEPSSASMETPSSSGVSQVYLS